MLLMIFQLLVKKKKCSLLDFLVVHDSDLKISLIRLVEKILMKCEV